MKIVIGPWLWAAAAEESPGWRAPEGCLGMLDLRSIPQQAAAGGSPLGYGIFALSDAAPDPGRDYTQLGTTLDATIGPGARSQLASALGIGSLSANRLNVLLLEMLTLRADWTGETFARPLMPGMDRRVSLRAVKTLLHRLDFSLSDAALLPTLTAIREQYRVHKQLVAAGRLPEDHHRRALDFLRKKLRLPWEALIPPDMTGEPGPLPHQTTISESFDTSDGDTLGPDLTWTEVLGDWDISGNAAYTPGGEITATARAETALSSDDHYAEVLMGTFATGRRKGPAVRFASSANTCYTFSQNNTQHRTGKIVSGTWTLLDDVAGDSARGVLVRLIADGSTLSLNVDGVEQTSFTDTAISGNLYTGIANALAGEASAGAIQSFGAADLAAATGNRRRRVILGAAA